MKPIMRLHYPRN